MINDPRFTDHYSYVRFTSLILFCLQNFRQLQVFQFFFQLLFSSRFLVPDDVLRLVCFFSRKHYVYYPTSFIIRLSISRKFFSFLFLCVFSFFVLFFMFFLLLFHLHYQTVASVVLLHLIEIGSHCFHRTFQLLWYCVAHIFFAQFCLLTPSGGVSLFVIDSESLHVYVHTPSLDLDLPIFITG